jgi:hypothetical protein
MKKLVSSSSEVIGYFNNIDVLGDRYRCDDIEYPFTVVGNDCVIEDWNDPAPIVTVITVPDEVTMRQARLALLSASKLDLVNTAINSLSGTLKEHALIEWEYSSTVKRNSQLISLIAPMIGLSASDVDNLFVTAKQFE